MHRPHPGAEECPQLVDAGPRARAGPRGGAACPLAAPAGRGGTSSCAACRNVCDEPGIARQSVVILRVEPKGSDQRSIPGTSERLDRTYRGAIRRTQEILVSASRAWRTAHPRCQRRARARRSRPSVEQTRVPLLMVYPNYFATIGMTISSGRDFETGDLAEFAPAVCIVNESFVRQVFAGQDPIGKPCYTGRRGRLLNCRRRRSPLRGAILDRRRGQGFPHSNPRGEIQPIIYMTFLQTNTGARWFCTRVSVRTPARCCSASGKASLPSIRRCRCSTFILEEEMGAARATAPGRPARASSAGLRCCSPASDCGTALICAGAADERAGHSDGARGPAP